MFIASLIIAVLALLIVPSTMLGGWFTWVVIIGVFAGGTFYLSYRHRRKIHSR